MAASCFTEVGSEGTFHPQEDAVNLLAKRALAASASSFEGVGSPSSTTTASAATTAIIGTPRRPPPPSPPAAADYCFCIAAQTAAYNTSTRTTLSIAAGYHRHEYHRWFQYFVHSPIVNICLLSPNRFRFALWSELTQF